MVSIRGRGGRNARGELGGKGRPQCTYRQSVGHIQKNSFSNDFPDTIANISKTEVVKPKFFDEEYKEYEVEI